jgi:hypothetical protein
MYEEVYVAGKSGGTVIRQGMSADNDVFNFLRVEKSE